jgi:5-methylthioadenosine/S-adenosylhomocysteine deaminase
MDRYMAYTGWDRYAPNRAGSPLEFLKKMGVHKGLLAVHAVHVTKRDMDLLANSGASVAHCPRSNHMLGVGRAPVTELMERGVNVALGTDSLTSNMDMDMWEEMRFAYLVNGLKAEQVIRMATINGARALHLDSVTGSLEPGKEADLIAVRTGSVTADNPCPQLLYGTRMGDVMLSMVQGKTIYKSEELKGGHGL